MESLIFLILGLVIYYLAYISPKTDKILYGFSGILLLFSAIAGFSSNSYIPIGEEIQYTHTTQNNQTIIDTESRSYTYSNSRLTSFALPVLTLFLSLYILIALGLDSQSQNGRSSKSGNEK